MRAIFSAKQRIPELDALRGLASLVVLFGHIDHFSDGVVTAMPWFWAVMELFFVLSGYLIGDIVLEHGRTPGFFRTFVLRRCLRIWPAYFAVLAFCLCLTPIAVARGWMGSVRAFPDFSQYFLFVQNLELIRTAAGGAAIQNSQPYAFGHTWSVAMEEQFYILCALAVPALLAGGRRSLGVVLRVLIGLVAVSVALRIIGTHWWVLPARLDGFVMGVVLAILIRASHSSHESSSLRRICSLALRIGGAASLCLATISYVVPIPELNHEIWGNGSSWQTLLCSIAVLSYSVFSFGIVGMCVLASGEVHLSALRNPWLRLLGLFSYSTYLWHIPAVLLLGAIVEKVVGVPAEFSMLVATVPVLAGSYCSYRVIERPCLEFARRRLPYRTTTASPPTGRQAPAR